MAHEDDDKSKGKDKDKTITVVINGTPEEVEKKDELTYDEVAMLAYPDFTQNPGSTYSITYTRGHQDGILSPGGSVKAKEGMSFRVNRTSQS